MTMNLVVNIVKWLEPRFNTNIVLPTFLLIAFNAVMVVIMIYTSNSIDVVPRPIHSQSVHASLLSLQRNEQQYYYIPCHNRTCFHETYNEVRFPWISAPNLTRTMTMKQHRTCIYLAAMVEHFLVTQRITYYMAGKTLLGSYIAHDILPWDNEVRLVVDYTDVNKLKRALQLDDVLVADLEKTGVLHISFNSSHYSNVTMGTNVTKDTYVTRDKCNIELLRQRRNTSHWWVEEDITYKPSRISDTFPLVYRPFGELWMPSPRNVTAVLRNKYPKFKCEKHIMSNDSRLETLQDRAKCKQLISYYPFVERQTLGDGAIETLVFDGKPLYRLKVDGIFPTKTTEYSVYAKTVYKT